MGVACGEEGALFIHAGSALHISPSHAPQATERLLTDPELDHEYLPITGLPSFYNAAAKLILGADSPAIKAGRVTSVQTISGTGANHLGGLFLSRFYEWNGDKKIYVSDPTWGTYFQRVVIALPSVMRHPFISLNGMSSEPLCHFPERRDRAVDIPILRPQDDRLCVRGVPRDDLQPPLALRHPHARVRTQSHRRRPDAGAVEPDLRRVLKEGTLRVLRLRLPRLRER